MTPTARNYVNLRVIYRLKDVQKSLAVLKRAAIDLQRFSGRNLTEDQLTTILERADSDSQKALKALADLKRDVKGFLRRI